MDLFDFFFPEQAQAAHLRKIASRQALSSAALSAGVHRSDELATLKADVRFLALVLTVVLKRLAETKTMSLADVQDLVDDVDSLDGSADGGLDPEVLRGLLGVLNRTQHADASDEEAFRVIAELDRRYRR